MSYSEKKKSAIFWVKPWAQRHFQFTLSHFTLSNVYPLLLILKLSLRDDAPKFQMEEGVLDARNKWGFVFGVLNHL